MTSRTFRHHRHRHVVESGHKTYRKPEQGHDNICFKRGECRGEHKRAHV